MTPKKGFFRNESGQVQTIMALVAGAITLVLGVLVFASVLSNVPYNASYTIAGPNNSTITLPTEAGSTITSLSTIFYSSSNLIVIGFIVLAAVFILSVVQRLRE
jgi:hypothetical protein